LRFQHVSVSDLQLANNEKLLNIITGDEAWVCAFDIEKIDGYCFGSLDLPCHKKKSMMNIKLAMFISFLSLPPFQL
jgi:hypothetical protein